MKRRRLIPLAAWICLVALAPLAPLTAGEGALPFADPGADHVLGTDALGRDVLAAVASGGPTLLAVAAAIAVLVTGLSAWFGSLAALHQRAGRAIDAAADAFILVPPVIGVLLIVLAWPGGGVPALLAATVVFGVPYCAKVVRSAAAAAAATGYVEAARASGESTTRIITVEMLPNLAPTLTAQLGLRFTEGLYVVAAVAFLRLPGVLDEGNWAVAVRDNAGGMLLNPWAVAVPAACLLVTVALVHYALPDGKDQP
jgi:ABC-type dipeptide/oligopeptide/nickel transport system permease subunit